MIFIKACILLLIFLVCLGTGKIIAKKYSNRVEELKDMENGLNMFLTKIKFTYASVPTSFREIGSNIKGNVGKIFIRAADEMNEKSAGESWEIALTEQISNLTKEDIEILKKLATLLGKTDVDGQISEIKLVQNFIETQIKLAEEEKQKNEKLYKTLGGVLGLAIVIILV